MRVAISGHIQTGSYTNKDGNKVYTTDVIVEEQEFAQSKSENEASNSNFHQTPAQSQSVYGDDGFMNIPDGIEDSLPFV